MEALGEKEDAQTGPRSLCWSTHVIDQACVALALRSSSDSELARQPTGPSLGLIAHCSRTCVDGCPGTACFLLQSEYLLLNFSPNPNSEHGVFCIKSFCSLFVALWITTHATARSISPTVIFREHAFPEDSTKGDSVTSLPNTRRASSVESSQFIQISNITSETNGVGIASDTPTSSTGFYTPHSALAESSANSAGLPFPSCSASSSSSSCAVLNGTASDTLTPSFITINDSGAISIATLILVSGTFMMVIGLVLYLVVCRVRQSRVITLSSPQPLLRRCRFSSSDLQPDISLPPLSGTTQEDYYAPSPTQISFIQGSPLSLLACNFRAVHLIPAANLCRP
ncbi:hypothetical protein A0H81_01762 [Grifola frondosa]|uniref:Uncharacterized protein n=1 Tax=Grifola frondosa TaxID=5627 RepID=A0A1C7MMB6_GRIFR|nr:hypothetical protein A0H81_01762 [Grifola frondosa]